MGNDNDVYGIFCHHLVEKGLQPVPFITSAFCIREKTVINCLFIALKVFP